MPRLVSEFAGMKATTHLSFRLIRAIEKRREEKEAAANSAVEPSGERPKDRPIMAGELLSVPAK